VNSLPRSLSLQSTVLYFLLHFHGDASFASRGHTKRRYGQRGRDYRVRETNSMEWGLNGDRLLYRSAGKSPCAFRTMTSPFFRAVVFRLGHETSRHVLAHPTTSVLHLPKCAIPSTSLLNYYLSFIFIVVIRISFSKVWFTHTHTHTKFS